MNKMTIALVAALTVTVSHIAFADTQTSQRIASDNAEYFQAKGVKDSGKPIVQNPDLQFDDVNANQRIGKENAEYFAKQPNTGKVTVAGANPSDYHFINYSNQAQRNAAR